MKITAAVQSAFLGFVAITGPAFGQGEPTFEMAEQCMATQPMGGTDHSSMSHGSPETAAEDGTERSDAAASDAMPDHVRENMRRMTITMPAMEAGIRKEDADVALACAMIAHHQGAIDMAAVLLEFGDDPQMIKLAREIIAAQKGEIDRMTAWLAENAD